MLFLNLVCIGRNTIKITSKLGDEIHGACVVIMYTQTESIPMNTFSVALMNIFALQMYMLTLQKIGHFSETSLQNVKCVLLRAIFSLCSSSTYVALLFLDSFFLLQLSHSALTLELGIDELLFFLCLFGFLQSLPSTRLTNKCPV